MSHSTHVGFSAPLSSSELTIVRNFARAPAPPLICERQMHAAHRPPCPTRPVSAWPHRRAVVRSAAAHSRGGPTAPIVNRSSIVAVRAATQMQCHGRRAWSQSINVLACSGTRRHNGLQRPDLRGAALPAWWYHGGQLPSGECAPDSWSMLLAASAQLVPVASWIGCWSASATAWTIPSAASRAAVRVVTSS